MPRKTKSALRELPEALPADFSPIRSDEAIAAAIVSESDDAVYCVTLDGVVRSWNAGAERLYGYRAAEVIGRRLFGIIPAEQRDEFEECLKRVANGERIRNLETARVNRQDHRLVISLSIYPIFDANDQTVAAAVVGRDETERKAAEIALREAANREEFLNRVGQAVRSSDNTREIQAIASAAAGQMLRADRCFFVLYDFENRSAHVEVDWRREELTPFAGTYATEENSEAYMLLSGGRTLVVRDVREDPRFEGSSSRHVTSGLVSLIRVPIVAHDQLVATMMVAMATEPRTWTPEEIRFAESIAAQARVALEAASSLMRQQRIAATLQAALQPPLPDFAPGLKLDSHYRAALEESSVGGDFYDGFSIGPQQTALVIGDMSGKGLQAAAQVASVRNMLRAMVDVIHPLCDALTALNNTLIRQELLRGFVTLFAGIYDSGTMSMTYVSAGHEPILVYRAATHRVEELQPTGSVLGIDVGCVFYEERVTLEPNDILLLYTDGISEAGVDRQTMLGLQGLADILLRNADAPSVPDLVKQIIADVDSYAGSALRDDSCIVVAKVLPDLSLLSSLAQYAA